MVRAGFEKTEDIVRRLATCAAKTLLGGASFAARAAAAV
jgi:hypothetical protein